MHMRGTNDQCKEEVHLRGARCKQEVLATCEHEMVRMTRANKMCKINRRRRTCEARIVANFLVWTSKLSKLWPKTCQDSHESVTERPKRSTWSPKWCQGGSKRSTWSPKCSQEGSKGHSKCAQGTPRGSKRLPKGDQNHRKSLLEAIWAPQEK